MRRTSESWAPVEPFWGLMDARTNGRVDPPAVVSAELIEMTDWELQDLAVQVVRRVLSSEGKQILSWQSNPAVDPSIWFVSEHGREWAVVRAMRYPSLDAPRPGHWSGIVTRCAAHAVGGYFASVGAANAADAFAPDLVAPIPLWRGHQMRIRYAGLRRQMPPGARRGR
jgi:hypothetical protein